MINEGNEQHPLSFLYEITQPQDEPCDWYKNVCLLQNECFPDDCNDNLYIQYVEPSFLKELTCNNRDSTETTWLIDNIACLVPLYHFLGTVRDTFVVPLVALAGTGTKCVTRLFHLSFELGVQCPYPCQCGMGGNTIIGNQCITNISNLNFSHF